MDITELLAFSVKHNASDLHLSAGQPPIIRVDGDIRRINLPPLEHRQVHSLVYDIMNDHQRKVFEEDLEVDFSFEIPNLARFRVNAFNQSRGVAAVFRTIPSKVLTLSVWVHRQYSRPLQKTQEVWCWLPGQPARVNQPPWRRWSIILTKHITTTSLPLKTLSNLFIKVSHVW